MKLPPEILINILSFTDLETIKNFREVSKELIDNNINFIFKKMRKTHHFLKYGKENVQDFNDFENTWNMEKYEPIMSNYIEYVRNFNIQKKNYLYFLLVNNVFHESISFHAVNNLNEEKFHHFKKLCHTNKSSYFQNYLDSIFF